MSAGTPRSAGIALNRVVREAFAPLLCAAASMLMASVALAATPEPAASVPPAAGTASAPALPTSPAKKELVRRVLTLQQPGIDALARTMAEQSVRPLMAAAGQALQNQVAMDKREAAVKQLDVEVRKYLDDATSLLREKATALAPQVIGPALEAKFTEEELKLTVSWLESSANQKYQSLGPGMQNAMAQRLVGDNRGAIEPKLKGLEERIANLLGLPPRAAASAGSGPTTAPLPSTLKPAPAAPAPSASKSR